MSDLVLIRKTIRGGQYEGQLSTNAKLRNDPVLTLKLPDGSDSDVSVTLNEAKPKTCDVVARVPGISLAEGIQTYVLQDSKSGKSLDSFAVVCGEPVQEDLRTEIALIRAELEMLKASFRKHVAESKR